MTTTGSQAARAAEGAAGVHFLARFLQAAESGPDRPAVVEAAGEVSYAEAAARVRRIAATLRSLRERPRVLIHLPQTADAYCAMLGVTYAGGYYSTTSTAAPVLRRRMVFDAFEPEVVITSERLADEARACAPKAAIVDVERLGPEESKAPAPAHRIVYVMYTSGSTGQPKGVVISQDALSHYVAWAIDAMALVPQDRWSQHPNIAFDLSVLDIFGALCSGAALVPIVAPADTLMPAQAIRNHGLTIWNSVPSVLTSMIKTRQLNPRNFEPLRLLTVCGEPLLPMHVEAVFGAAPEAIVHNTYGPTEATVSMTLERMTRDNYRDACRSTVALGDPIPGMGIELVGGESPQEGEIVITGPQLADGYWNDPAQTEARFRTFVGADGRSRRGYFTGDWARQDGGKLFFAGRMDHQVKIRGERVELEDINAALMKWSGCFACSALADDVLHAWFETDRSLESLEAARAGLKELLPPHFIPRQFHVAHALPRNANGKVDLSALKAAIAPVSGSAAAEKPRG
jgi:D-alanine--poly(phosphoribitol) ligase subunit 1